MPTGANWNPDVSRGNVNHQGQVSCGNVNLEHSEPPPEDIADSANATNKLATIPEEDEEDADAFIM